MTQAYKDIKSESGEKLIDAFLKENTQCNILVHWMRKIFIYLVYNIIFNFTKYFNIIRTNFIQKHKI
jgi:hypothetical protein